VGFDNFKELGERNVADRADVGKSSSRPVARRKEQWLTCGRLRLDKLSMIGFGEGLS
jgi:hypothetical protein